MGYHLTITKTKGTKRIEIPQAAFVEASSKEESLVLDYTKTIARFYQAGELIATLTWQDGEVWTKNSDDEVLALMLRLAKNLNAQVKGSEGETYRSVHESYLHPDDKLKNIAVSKTSNELRRKNLLKNIIWLILFLIVIWFIVWN